VNKNHETILIYLYRYRFLKREQLQKLFKHKNHRTILLWLNQLTKTDYIRRYYNPKTINTPALYSLGLKGRAYLKENKRRLKISLTHLNRIWREPELSLQFRYNCLLIADIYLSLEKLIETTGAKLRFFTKSDLYSVKDLPLPHPDIFFHIEEIDGVKKYYFLDIFNYFTHQIKFKKRIEQYYDYYDEDTWQESTDDRPFPTIIFVCSDKRSYNYINWYLRENLLEDDNLDFYLTTKKILNTEGLTRHALKKVMAKVD